MYILRFGQMIFRNTLKAIVFMSLVLLCYVETAGTLSNVCFWLSQLCSCILLKQCMTSIDYSHWIVTWNDPLHLQNTVQLTDHFVQEHFASSFESSFAVVVEQIENFIRSWYIIIKSKSWAECWLVIGASSIRYR